MYSRGEVSRMFGIKESTLRYYEREGVVVPVLQEGGSNNRRGYTEEDLERLHQLAILREYGLGVETIKQVFDGQMEFADALQDQLDELIREENRIRNLMLFTKFLEVTDSELVYGLEFGPKALDDLADHARHTKAYETAMSNAGKFMRSDFRESLHQLGCIINDFSKADPYSGFSEVVRVMDELCNWWDENLVSTEEAGYLGIWSVLEDDPLLAATIESYGTETTLSALQMHLFYVWMKRLVSKVRKLAESVARTRDKDIVLAMEKAAELASIISQEMCFGERDFEAACYFLGCMVAFASDERLSTYLELDGLSDGLVNDIEKAKEVLALAL